MDDYTWNDLMQTAVPTKEHALRHVFAAEDIVSEDDDDDDEGDVSGIRYNSACHPSLSGIMRLNTG